MKQLTRSEFNKQGTTYKSVTSPDTDGQTTQITDIVENNGRLAYSTNGSDFTTITNEVQQIDDVSTIYPSPNALPVTGQQTDGEVYCALTNGELPLNIYKFSLANQQWDYVDQVKTGVLYFDKNTGLLYVFRSSNPYFEATSYTDTSQLTNGAGYATTSDITSAVGAETTARENADTTLQNNINAKYTKPATGIPKEDLAQAVIDSLNLADSALQSVSSSDVTNALGFTPYNATNPNGYTKVESSTTNGNIKINGNETAVYTLPSEIIATINAKYTKPANGIPKTDLAQGVQDSLDAADAAQSNITALQTAVNTINGKIPTQATSSNQLADKAFVNSSINAFAAYYITKNAAGDPFATKAELNAATIFYSGGAARTPTTNDYCIVLADETKQSETGVDPTTRYSYQGNQWEYQYTINNTPLTAAQLSAINSGVTSATVSQVTTNANNISSLQTGKQDKLTAGTNITIDPNTNTISATGGSSITSINGLSGGTLTSPLTITGGDSATASKIILDTNGQITDTGTSTLFGRSGTGSTLMVGHSSYTMTMRGSATRPTYNGNNLALYSDLPTDTGATSITTSGTGNAVTSASYNASTRKITLTKGSTFLTSAPVSSVSGRTGAVTTANLIADMLTGAAGYGEKVVAKSMGQTGYIKYESGLVLQWGTLSKTDGTLTFPYTNGFSSTSSYIVQISSKSTTNAGMANGFNPSSRNGGSYRCYGGSGWWFAIGY